MIDIKNWTSEFTKKAKNIFGERIYFIGIQGSYARNEANEKSDIDIVLILDKIDMGDLEKYKGLLDMLPNREFSCGFVSGKEELLNWEPSDLFQFYYDTTPIVGTLDFLLSKIDKQDVKRAIKIGKCNIYHACVHNFIHEQSDEILRSLYKSATFVIQAIFFYNNGKYVRSKKELLPLLNGSEKEILETAVKLKNGANINFEEMTEKLFNWVKNVDKI